MVLQIFPEPSTSSVTAKSITCTTSYTLYEATMQLEPAVYTITTSSNEAVIYFMSGPTTINLTTSTSSSTVTVNLATASDKVRVYSGGTNIVVTIDKISETVSNTFSGVLDTITSTGTYTGTSTSGYGYVILSGAGGGGSGRTNANGDFGGGGGGAGVAGKVIALTGSMAVTIGAGGNAGLGGTNRGQATNGNAGGNSSFSNLTTNGGIAGSAQTANVQAVRGNGGSASGGDLNYSGEGFVNAQGDAGRYEGGRPGAGSIPYMFVTTEIGNGGSGSGSGNAGRGNGYGGGGGGGLNVSDGKPGSSGVLYVLRF